MVVIPLVLVLAVGVWFVAFRDKGSSGGAATTTQQLVAVTQGPIGDTVSAEGTIAAAQTANLTFPSSGTVTAVNVKAGDPVTAGEVLATLDSAQLVSTVSAAQANVVAARAALSDDQAAGASSAQVAADQASLQSANDALTNAQQSLAGSSLVATFDGTVSQVNVIVGEKISSSGSGGVSATGSGTGSGQSASTPSSGSASGGESGTAAGSSSSSPAIQVISKGRYTVTVNVASSNIDNVAVGQNAMVTVATSSATGGFGGGVGEGIGHAGGTAEGGAAGASPSGGGAAGVTTVAPSTTGSVTSVSKVATASSGAAGYPTVITFNADAKAFYVGATVTAAIATNATFDVIQVPTRAISTRNGKSVVTVATDAELDGHTATRVVTTGITAGGATEITSGLQSGERVVITLSSFFGGGRAGTTDGTDRTTDDGG